MNLVRGFPRAGRPTVVVVLVLLGTFLLVDSYTYRILYNLSRSFSFISSSSTDYANREGFPRATLLKESNLTEVTDVLQSNFVAENELSKGDREGFGGDTGPGSHESEFQTSESQLHHQKHVQKSEPPTLGAPASSAETQTMQFSPTNQEISRSRLTSFQSVELDLWNARAALKRVIRERMDRRDNNKTVTSFVEEPHGEAYKDADLLRESYRQMELRFKVYIYPEGEEPLAHDGPCKEIYSIEGRFIEEIHNNNPFVTSDPEEAHVFFLPFSVSMVVTYLYTLDSGDMSPISKFVQDYVQIVASGHSYWNRSHGADHFMLSCHDWGPYVTRHDKYLYKNLIRVLCNANTSEGFSPYRDASLPEINLVGGELPSPLGGLAVLSRPYLAFFAGGDHGPVRPLLFDKWEGNDSDIIVYRQVPSPGPTYHDYMKSSKFCLCPGGYEVSSPRVVEAIYNDCIPVIIADAFVLPFSDVLNWSKFSLHVLEKRHPQAEGNTWSCSCRDACGNAEKGQAGSKTFPTERPTGKIRCVSYDFTFSLVKATEH